MSDWIEKKFCPNCGTFLKKNSNGDTICGQCGLVVNEKHTIHLNKVEKKVSDYSALTKITERIKEHSKGEKIFNIDTGYMENTNVSNINGVKHNFFLLMERFGVALTKYYEEYHSRQALDYSRNTGYGYDVLSTQKDSKENRYIEVKTCLGVKRSIQLTLNEYSFLVKERSPEKWLYIILLDRIDLLGRNFDECFSFFRVPCSQLQVSCFERVNPSRRTLRYNSWRPLSNRYRVSLPNEMGVVLHHIRDEYMKLFPDRVSRVLWYFNHRKEALNKGDNSMISNANIS